jgi:O-antigen ligase
VAALAGVEQGVSGSNGTHVLVRLCGTGVFNDPNDFSLVLAMGGIICAYGFGQLTDDWRRWLLLMPGSVFGYGLFLTQSRSGFIAVIAGGLTFVGARFGWRMLAAMVFVGAPLLLLPMWGRLASFDLGDPEDTFQTRLVLWRESFDAFWTSPLMGIGRGKLAESIGHVSHNSYLQAFVELGLFGGLAFLGAFYLSIRGLLTTRPAERDLFGLRPCVLAIVVSYAVGLLALSRCYTVSTHLVLGWATAYLTMTCTPGNWVIPRMDWACVRRLGCVGAVVLTATYVFVRIMIQQA